MSAGGDKTVFLWDVAAGNTIRRWTGHAGRINAVSFAGVEESVVVSGSWDGTAKLWDTKSNSYKPILVLDDAKDSVSDIAVSGEEIVVGSVDGKIRAYDLRMGECAVDTMGHAVTSVNVSKRGEEVLVSCLDSSVRLMDRGNGKLLKAYRDEGFVNTEMRVRSTLGMNDSVVVSGSEDETVVAWDLLEGTVLHRFRHSTMKEVTGQAVGGNASKRDVVSDVAFCGVRDEWASAGADGNVVVWGMGS